VIVISFDDDTHQFCFPWNQKTFRFEVSEFGSIEFPLGSRMGNNAFSILTTESHFVMHSYLGVSWNGTAIQHEKQERKGVKLCEMVHIE
jgi:hypothetical protein